MKLPLHATSLLLFLMGCDHQAQSENPSIDPLAALHKVEFGGGGTQMADELPEKMLYEGVSVDIIFANPRPSFGDLFQICGTTHPRFPPTGEFGFDRLAGMRFEQVDDYFGVRSQTDEGDEVSVWLFPLVDGEEVYHHQGPFDGVRLSYNVLRNPQQRSDQFLRCVKEFAALGVDVVYQDRGVSLGSPPDLSAVQADIAAIVKYWAAEGVVVGSPDALDIDY